MAVTPEEVRAVAALARLELRADEIEAMTAKLNGILAHMEALSGSGAPAGPDEDDDAGRAPLRPDRPAADPLAFGPERLAPAWADGFFTVPRLASHAEGGAVGEGGPTGAGEA